MTIIRDITNLSVCQDCMLIIANDDASGISEERLAEILDAWEACWSSYMFGCGNDDPAADEDGTYGFRAAGCDACGTSDHGDRYAAHAFPV